MGSIHMVWEETDEKTNDLKARQIMARNVETCQTHQNVKRNKSEQSRNQNSIMPDDYVVFTSLTLKTRSSSL